MSVRRWRRRARAVPGLRLSVCAARLQAGRARCLPAARLVRVMSAQPAAAAGFAAAAAAGFGGGAEPAAGYPYYPSPPDGYYSLQNWGYPADMSPSEYSPPPPPPPPPGYPVLPPGQYPPEAYGALPAGWDAAPPRPSSRTLKPKRGANKKERRRTMSINNAFAELRERIPNVPADTKLSKIKTLRLATSYIAYLSDILQCDPVAVPVFKAEVKKTDRNDEKRKLVSALICPVPARRSDLCGVVAGREISIERLAVLRVV